MSESPNSLDTSTSSIKSGSRKLKQARLSFQVISPEMSSKPNGKKRKLEFGQNENGEEILAKIPKSEETKVEKIKSENEDDKMETEIVELEKTDENELTTIESDDEESNLNKSKENETIKTISTDEEKSPSKQDNEITFIEEISKEKRKESEMIKTSTDEETPSKSNKTLTPKQMKKKMESTKKREEREKMRLEKEREKQEKEKEKQEKKEMKEKLKLEKEKEKERIKKEKEMKRIEKEEKEKKKQELIDAKNEEKKLKEEEKRKKEERKQAAAAAFTSFFVTKKSTSDLTKLTCTSSPATTIFMPFQIKTDMRLAPSRRVEFNKEKEKHLDEFFVNEGKDVEIADLYLNLLKSKKYTPKKDGKTWPLSELKEVDIDDQNDNDIYIIPSLEEAGLVQHLEFKNDEKPPKAKLLMFHENQRPPYWGTWRKTCKTINPRRPFAKEEILDYNIDSELEWEDEEPGESLQGSEDDRESEDEYEVDNEFFVPHGYLSDEENEVAEDESEQLEENKENKEINKDAQREKLHKMEIDFEQEMKKKTTRIQSTIIGCIWREDLYNQKVSTQLKAMIMSRCAMFDQSLPIDVIPKEVVQSSSPQTNSPSSDKKFDDEDLKNLVRLVQKNPNSQKFLAQEFSSFLSNECQKSGKLSKRQISIKIKEIAEWKMNNLEGSFKGRLCWMVKPDILKAYQFNDQQNETSWNYTLKPKIVQEPLVELKVEPSNLNTPKDNIPLITKFTKVFTKEEKERQFSKKENLSTSTCHQANAESNIVDVDDDVIEIKIKDGGGEQGTTSTPSTPTSTPNTTPSSKSSSTSRLTNFIFKSNK